MGGNFSQFGSFRLILVIWRDGTFGHFGDFEGFWLNLDLVGILVNLKSLDFRGPFVILEILEAFKSLLEVLEIFSQFRGLKGILEVLMLFLDAYGYFDHFREFRFFFNFLFIFNF